MGRLCGYGGGAISVVLLTVQTASMVDAQSLDAYRDYEPVVIEGSAFASWVDVANISEIVLYKYNGSSFTAIPFQIDKRRKITLNWNVSQLAPQSVCEYGYFPEEHLPSGQTDVFADPKLKPTDEIVFMLKDAGSVSDPLSTWHPGYSETPPKVQGTRWEIILTDSRTGAQRYVYAYRWVPGYPNDASAVKYVQYTRDPNALLTCELCPGDEKCKDTNQPTVGRPCGTAQSKGASIPSPIATLKSHFFGNWITDAFTVKAPGGDTPYCVGGSPPCEDMLERIHYKEDSWDENDLSDHNDARFLGVSGDPAAGQTVEMPVRIVRAIQGARSGVKTTKYEFIYPTRLHTRVNVRVHGGVQTMRMWVNHDRNIKLQDLTMYEKNAYVWTKTEFDQDGTMLDKIDGSGPGYTEFVEPAPDDWTEVPSERRGTYVHFYSEPRSIPSANRTYTYKDIYTTMPLAEDLGSHGRQYTGTNPVYGLGNTADGNDFDGTAEEWENDGGCPSGSDPESPLLNFARFETIFIPHELRSQGHIYGTVVADDFSLRRDSPVHATFEQHSAFTPRPGGSSSICPPVISSTNRGDGFVDHVLTRCQFVVDPVFHRIYRGLGSGPLKFYKDLRSALTWTDINTVPGQTYRYAARAYYSSGLESTDSNIVTVAVTDTTTPAVPTGLVGVAGLHSASLSWQTNWNRDLWGYNVYRSTVSGGPYTKLNSNPILAGAPRQYAATGLTTGQTYYFVIKAIDFAANESAPTGEVVVTSQ